MRPFVYVIGGGQGDPPPGVLVMWRERQMYKIIRIVFLSLTGLFGGLVVVFLIYVCVKKPGEFFQTIFFSRKALGLIVYFIPAIACYCIADWAGKKSDE